MTYRMNPCCSGPGMGSYYTYGSGQVYGMAGIAEEFNADAVWADVQAGGQVGQLLKEKSLMECDKIPEACAKKQAQIGNANFRGNRGANTIREALRELGYSPGPNDQVWAPQDINAWEAFLGDHGISPGPGLVNKTGLDKMQAELQAKGTGPSLTKAGLTPLGWGVLALAAGAAGYALLSGRKKKKDKPVPTGRAMVPMR